MTDFKSELQYHESRNIENYAISAFHFLEIAAQCDSIQSLNKYFNDFVEPFGVQSWMMAKVDYSGTILPSSAQILYGGKPSSWIHVYFAKKLYLADPILKHAADYDGAVRWNDIIAKYPMTQAQSRMMAEAAEFGFCDGISVPVYCRDGIIRILSMAGGRIDPSPCALNALGVAGQNYGMHGYRLLRSARTAQQTACAKVLTGRQREILNLCRQGLRAREIAAKLDISTKAVEDSLSHSRAKFYVRSTAQLIAEAITGGELD